MSYNLKNQRGVFHQPIRFSSMSSIDAKELAQLLQEKADQLGVPAKVTTDEVREGGLFGKSYPCVVINHPNPPQQYFTNVYLVNGNIISFLFFGNSQANYKTNVANARAGSIMGSIANAFSGSNEIALQTENSWHNEIFDLFESLFN